MSETAGGILGQTGLAVTESYLVGQSEKIRKVFDLIERVSDSDSTVLIMGESGTGKELVARAIHERSPRRGKPFIPVNCGAIPEGLMEAEFFGHEKGAFTGAVEKREGRFELADGGTIFLDEISEMPPYLQVKLLRVIQEKAFERVGGMKTLTVDVRIVAATNRNLENEVREGRFREDLFYRLNVIPIEIPPLRERREDIPLLCEYFVERFSRKHNKPPVTLSRDVMEVFSEYSWPGNVRELENTIERLTVLKGGSVIVPYDLPRKMLSGKIPDVPGVEEEVNPINGIDLEFALREYEKRLILNALSICNNVKSRAARYLNINRTTLIQKMKRLGLE
ncbi:MAG: sigma-54-dependent Fis family transcriptional regulator [Deltaproteobacteria bacterium]|nr:MAG: sigma-54-dependent Fis family transcriptional regulator [Deltaproteobacteria bacterium]